MPTQVLEIPLDKIYTEAQARKYFHEPTLNNMAKSIKELGVLEPILVRYQPRKFDGAQYVLISGEQRWRASEIAEMQTIPAIVSNESEARTELMAIHANTQRRDLTVEEECAVVKDLLEKGFSNARILATMDKSWGWLSNRTDYLVTAADVREVGHRVPKKMIALVWADKVKDQNLRRSLLRRIEREDMPTEAVKKEALAYLDRKAITDKADRLRAAQSKAPDAFTERARAQHERDESERRFRSIPEQTEATPAPTRATLPTDEIIDDAHDFEPFVSPVDVLGGGTVATIEAPPVAVETPAIETADAEQSRAEGRAAKEEIAADARRALTTLESLTDLTDDETYDEIAEFARRVLRGDLRR